ncbi:MAG TPA: hypothetical protein DCL43_06795 [Chitinophagaceae bacterium]|nr:hypothetical protein [Chitinophagaceae bacterium]HAN40279.1 hypothetical protein [Chitinophagaceae bacterium]
MKLGNNNNSIFSVLSNNSLQQLTTQVAETLATDVMGAKKIFSAADLWKVQRMRRARNTRRELVLG